MVRNHSIDLLRILGIFCVILLHVDLQNCGIYGATARMASRWAVPYFFLVSGHFAGCKNISISDSNRRHSLKRLLSWVVFADLFYLPYALHQDFLGLAEDPTTGVIKYLVTGTSFHLWFLHTLLFGQVAISLASNNRNCRRLAIILGIVIASAQLARLEECSVFLGLSSLGYGIPFLAAGLVLSRLPWRKNAYLQILIAGIILQCGEYSVYLSSNDLNAISSTQIFWGTPFLAIGFAGYALNSHDAAKTSSTKQWHQRIIACLSCAGASQVLGIYLIHIYVRILINSGARVAGFYDAAAFRMISPLLILTASLAVLLSFQKGLGIVSNYWPRVKQFR